METLEEFLERWEKTYRYGSVEDRLRRKEKWDDYYSLIFENESKRTPETLQSDRIEYLFNEDIIGPDSEVLDIGCGSGLHALCMAQRCRRVKAIDGNRKAIEVLEKRKEELKIGNIETECMAFERYTDPERYDLVYSSMCPAICDLDSFRKMESLSKDRCAIVTVVKGSYDYHRKRMMERLELRPEGMVSEAGMYTTLLELLGRRYTVKHFSEHYEYKTGLDQLLKVFVPYLGIFGIDEERSERFIRDYFAENETDGRLNDSTQMNSALIVWSVKGE